jgi:hypothetical protein
MVRQNVRCDMVRVALSAWFFDHFSNNQMTTTPMTTWRKPAMQTESQERRNRQEGRLRWDAVRSNNVIANIKKHKPEAEQDSHITYLELGLGIAGAFFPFSPFPSYPFPRVVVLDMLRDGVFDLLERCPARRNGLEARRTETLVTGDANTVGANRRTRCIQSAQMEEYNRNKGDISNSIRRQGGFGRRLWRYGCGQPRHV